ncbi:MAG: PDZ domain-containing protein [Candidatus Obscuribacterales bacterium]|nr:PDZ domain-containing protein [Candidatus Obscuribacterales bacterium]
MKQSLIEVASRTSVALALVLSCVIPCGAEDNTLAASSYKTAEPKLDTTRPADQTKPAPKFSGPLTGNIQKLDKHNPAKGRSMFGGRLGTPNGGLRGRTDDSLSRPLAVQAQSSIGIIGVKFVATNGAPPVINQVFPGTPADEKGLHINDRIVAVDGVPTAGLTKDEVFDLIVGSPGTPVTLSIMRGNDFSAIHCVRMDINELTDPRVRRDYMTNL